MTKLQAGALEVKREWVPLEEVVGSALTRLESRLDGRAIYARLPADLPLISADPVLLEQVFSNLLDNATKHTPPSSPVEIGARIEGGALVVEVSDRGPGLPAGSEAMVFEKFFRAAPGGPRGAGLGLAICRGIVQAHGGTITARTRPEGGATFRISLPLAGEAPSVPVEPELSA
jgi:two-component system sensor histidine kinase KdpD